MLKLKKINAAFSDIIGWISLFVVIVIVPLVMRVYMHTATVDEQTVYVDEMLWDVFSYYKSLILTVIFWVIIVSLACDFIIGDKKLTLKKIKDPVITASLIYCLFVILSVIFSQYRTTAISGVNERFEGLFPVLSYITIMLTARHLCRDKRSARVIYCFLLASGIIIGCIGAGQTFGFDIWQTQAGIRAIMHQYYHLGDPINLYDKAYMTLHNPNSAGLFAAFMLPIFVFVTYYTQDSKILRVLSGIAAVLMLICLYGSASVAGFIGTFSACIISAVIISIRIYKNTPDKKRFYTAAGLCAAGVIIVTAMFYNRISSLIIYHFNIDGSKYPNAVMDIEMDGSRARIIGTDDELIIEKTEDDIILVGYEPYTETDFGSHIQRLYDVPWLLGIDMRFDSELFYVGDGQAYAQFFFAEDNGRLILLNSKLEPVDLSEKAPSIGFNGMERFATGRGYIWSRSIPLLANSIIIGNGPDTFIYAFPHNDLRGFIHAFGQPYSIVDKPHNMYLQVGINTGVISLIALLFIFGCYLYGAFVSLIKGEAGDRFLFAVRFGLFAGIFAYLVTSLSTDSLVSVSPVFYTALGVGLGLEKV